jgi:hypothetical protein
MPGFPIAGSAGLEDVEDMNAAFAALKGCKAIDGLAGRRYQLNQYSLPSSSTGDAEEHIPRSANAVACLVLENMATTCANGWERKDQRRGV